jgi:hypothetical protein
MGELFPNISFLCLIQLSALALVIKAFFLKSRQELPVVALPCLEKIALIASGLSLQSGAGRLSLRGGTTKPVIARNEAISTIDKVNPITVSRNPTSNKSFTFTKQ